MKEDRDLIFLANCKNDDLKTLVDILTHDKDGDVRYSEELTNTYAYSHCYPNRLNNMWKEIAGELQKFGGNTIANVCRGEGVAYKTILKDVCKKLKVCYSDNDSTENIEKSLLEKLTKEAIEKMSEKELRKLAVDLNISSKCPEKYLSVAIAQVALCKIAYFSKVIFKMLLGRGATMASKSLLGRAFGAMTGPVGWAVTAGWTLYDITSPAYRVTIPCVVQIACMRMQQESLKK